jgi:uncharacterized beta-barrel protein YwiB (DUF1934 family)
MRVNLEFERIEEGGESGKLNFVAVLEILKGAYPYRLVYMQDVSDDGKFKAKSELLISKNSMRMISKGDLEEDLFLEKNVVHNTFYNTPYGAVPISVETLSYAMEVWGDIDADSVNYSILDRGGDSGNAVATNDFTIEVSTIYKLTLKGAEPMTVDMKIRVTPF